MAIAAVADGPGPALSAVGVYAVVSYAIARRTRELGIRVALGAATASVLALVLRTSLAIAVTGVAFGLLASLWVGRLIALRRPDVRAGLAGLASDQLTMR